MTSPTRWRRHAIEHLGFSVDVMEGPPLETWRRPTGGGLFQALPGNEGTLFVRWGESASLEVFETSLTDLLTNLVETTETPVEILGREAHRVAATVERSGTVSHTEDPEGGVTHTEEAAKRYRTEVLSFSRGNVPVLVGYRLVEASVPDHDALLRHFLASVRAIDT